MGCSNSTMQGAATPRAVPMLQREKTGFVAFEIDITNNKTKELNKDIDKILSRPLPPKRLQALDPIDKGPMLTAEELERRMVLAEEKRQRTMEKRMEFSRRGSLRRQSIAREARPESALTEKMNAAEELRAQRLMDIKERERKKSERVTKIRDEVRRKREGVDEIDSEFREVECMESSDEEMSWKGSADKMKKLPPINKIKIESGTDSSGYSSRNISATQDVSREPISKVETTNDKLSADNELMNYKITQPKIPFKDVDNFYDTDSHQESDNDLSGNNRSGYSINDNQKHSIAAIKLF